MNRPRTRRRYQTTTLLTVGCFAVLGGILMARSGEAFSVWFLVVSLFLSTWMRRRGMAALAAVLCLGLAIGWWRGAMVWQGITVYQNYFGKPATLSIRAAEDATYNDKQQLAFAADNVRIGHEGEWLPLPGRVSISSFGAPAVYRGDAITVTGKLMPSRGSTVARMSFATLQVTGRPSDALLKLRQSFAAKLESTLPEPLASFGLGILIGQRSTLPKNLNEDLSKAGLTHLVAVSGYNLTILVNVARRLLRKNSHFQSTVVAAMLVVAFLLITGFSASIVRAAIIAGLSLATGYYGRNLKPMLLLGLSALVTAIYNPLYIWFDVGWYLSFTAFFGVIVLAPLITQRFWKKRGPKLVAQVVIESGSAQLATMPIITGVFGQLSVVGMASNVLILPLVPMAMLLTTIAGVGGWLGPWFSGILAWPGRMLLTYILDLTSVCARLPHSVVPVQLSQWEVAVLYGLIIVLCLLLYRSPHAGPALAVKPAGRGN